MEVIGRDVVPGRSARQQVHPGHASVNVSVLRVRVRVVAMEVAMGMQRDVLFSVHLFLP